MQEIDTTTAKLLLIDDEVHSVKLMEAILKQAGYRSITASNDPRQAIELFRTVKPDLLVLDMRMPHLDGIEVMRQLLPVVAWDEYFPILIVTGELDVATKHKALAEGAKDFLTKPVDAIEVALRIKNQLLTRQLHDQLEATERAPRAGVVEDQGGRTNATRYLHRLALAAGYRHATRPVRTPGEWDVSRRSRREPRGLSPDQVEADQKGCSPSTTSARSASPTRYCWCRPFTEADREVMRQHVKIGSKSSRVASRRFSRWPGNCSDPPRAVGWHWLFRIKGTDSAFRTHRGGCRCLRRHDASERSQVADDAGLVARTDRESGRQTVRSRAQRVLSQAHRP
ncbi:MAG: response regulator [Nitrospiraceae bacterium]